MSRKLFLTFLTLIFVLKTEISLSLTLDEAIKRAFDVSYAIREQLEVIDATRFSYLSSLDPYFPKAVIETSYSRTLSPMSDLTGLKSIESSRDLYRFSGVLSYRLYDGGERASLKGSSMILHEREKIRLNGLRQALAHDVKSAFYEILGKKGIVRARHDAYELAKRIYDVVKARYDVGIAKKSELLQAQLRMESSYSEYENSILDLKKAVEKLRSILLLDGEVDVEGELTEPNLSLTKGEILSLALSKRPEILIQEKEIKRLEYTYSLKKSIWYPKVDLSVQHQRYDTSFFPERRDDQLILSLSLPIFDGLGRFYNLKAVRSEINSANENLKEKRRLIELEVINALIDFEISKKNLEVFKRLYELARISFEQAFGEFRVGKGDILTVLTLEKEMQQQREKYILALIQANVSLSYLEKVGSIKDY